MVIFDGVKKWVGRRVERESEIEAVGGLRVVNGGWFSFSGV